MTGANVVDFKPRTAPQAITFILQCIDGRFIVLVRDPEFGEITMSDHPDEASAIKVAQELALEWPASFDPNHGGLQ